ncbi:MAG: 2Fe-2S iron-sulfur cluster-binding protein [Beijerinckiaceae bacterium]|jgi:2Fe-2S ferredoxin|nr:2Fe-2S iron-sulfur cluster-binding protein [Beijerinckiaceae bacterium]
MAQLHVIDQAGNAHTLDTVEGWRVMELLREQKVGLEGQCGGACLCATCHVIVAPEWADRLPPPREEELEKLDELPVLEPTSRLSCQILWSDGLDGLTLTLPEPV